MRGGVIMGIGRKLCCGGRVRSNSGVFIVLITEISLDEDGVVVVVGV